MLNPQQGHDKKKTSTAEASLSFNTKGALLQILARDDISFWDQWNLTLICIKDKSWPGQASHSSSFFKMTNCLLSTAVIISQTSSCQIPLAIWKDWTVDQCYVTLPPH